MGSRGAQKLALRWGTSWVVDSSGAQGGLTAFARSGRRRRKHSLGPKDSAPVPARSTKLYKIQQGPGDAGVRKRGKNSNQLLGGSGEATASPGAKSFHHMPGRSGDARAAPQGGSATRHAPQQRSFRTMQLSGRRSSLGGHHERKGDRTTAPLTRRPGGTRERDRATGQSTSRPGGTREHGSATG